MTLEYQVNRQLKTNLMTTVFLRIHITYIHLLPMLCHIWNYPVSTLNYTITVIFLRSKFLSNTCLQMIARSVVCTESRNTSFGSSRQSLNAHSSTFIFIWRIRINAFITCLWNQLQSSWQVLLVTVKHISQDVTTCFLWIYLAMLLQGCNTTFTCK